MNCMGRDTTLSPSRRSEHTFLAFRREPLRSSSASQIQLAIYPESRVLHLNACWALNREVLARSILVDDVVVLSETIFTIVISDRDELLVRPRDIRDLRLFDNNLHFWLSLAIEEDANSFSTTLETLHWIIKPKKKSIFLFM
jgi:hypothetical protein